MANNNIGVFGGSFNPIHIGHYHLIKRLLSLRLFDRTLVFPAAKNPLKNKSDALPANVRLEMLEKTLEEFSDVTVDLFEMNQGGDSYTVNTLRYVARKFSKHIHLVMGMDSYATFPQWKDADEILTYCDIIVFHRKGYAPSPGKGGDGAKNPVYVQADLPDVSSALIRQEPSKHLHLIHPKARAVWKMHVASQ